MPVELPSELLSGPDLGGGFLFQLTREESPSPGSFTFHLQEAGTDASQAPAGSPGSLGFVRPATPCMYGGNACWHLVLPLPGSDRSIVRVAYNRTRFVIDPMLAQAAHARAAPIGPALNELLGRIAARLESARSSWLIGGSAGAWIRGLAIEPADIDLAVADSGTPLLAELLEEYLVVPNHPSPLPDVALRGAAFIGTLKAGIRVEWRAAGADDRPSAPPSEWGGNGWEGRIQWVEWEGFRVPLAPLEFEIVRLAERAQTARLDRLIGSLGRVSVDRELLGGLLSAAGVPGAMRAHVERGLDAPHGPHVQA